MNNNESNNLTSSFSFKNFYEDAKSLILIVVAALCFRTFIMEPFYIPSSSMKSTLLKGDYIFTTKYNYGFSSYSLPFAPNLFKGRILAQQPQRGDIVVFWPNDFKERYIKRLVGLPGDTVQIRDSIVYINGKPLAKKYAKVFKEKQMGEVTIKQFNETIDNELRKEQLSYNVLQTSTKNIDYSHHSANNTQVFKVPEGEYFMLGDNRDNSKDSRFIGTIPFANLIGKAQFIHFSDGVEFFNILDEGITAQLKQIGLWFRSIRFKRIFTNIYKIHDN